MSTMNPPPPSYESIQDDRRVSLSNSRTPRRSTSTRRPANPSMLPLRVPTKKYLLSSGFPYHSSIFDLGISPDKWTQFSDEIIKATKLSVTQQSLAWTSAISVGLVSVAALPPFGAAAGVFIGKAVYDKSIMSNVRQGLEQGRLGEVLKRWNDECWREKGLVVTLVIKQGKDHHKHESETARKESPKKDAKRRMKKDHASDSPRKQRDEAGHFELVLESIDTVSSSVPDRSTVILRSSSDLEDIRTDTVPVELDNAARDGPSPTTCELPIMSNADEKADNQAPPVLPPRPAHIPSSPPDIVIEKVDQADAARSSWTSAHPAESVHSPRPSLVDENILEEGEEGNSSPVSEISRWSYAARDDARISRDIEFSPVLEAERRYFDHLRTPIDTALAPAPLFAR
ncbi:hypothetical protein ACLMJK_003257 [Lecanora helva]